MSTVIVFIRQCVSTITMLFNHNIDIIRSRWFETCAYNIFPSWSLDTCSMPSKPRLILCRAPGLIKAEQLHAQDSSVRSAYNNSWKLSDYKSLLCVVSMESVQDESVQDELGKVLIKIVTKVHDFNADYLCTLPIPPGHPKHPITFLNRPGIQVLFVGEGNFTFTVAFAAYKGSLQGIWSTQLEDKPMPSVDNVIFNCLKSITSYYENKRSKLPEDSNYLASSRSLMNDCREKVSQLMALNVPSDFIPWKCGIDATKIDQDDVWRSITGAQPTDRPPFNAIWFQCPWTDWKKIGTLIKTYLCSAATILQPGDIVCVGIINNSKYTPRYELDKLLKDEEVLKKCDYVGVDNTLVGEMLKLGYHHEGLKNLHKWNIDNHITLVFAKK